MYAMLVKVRIEPARHAEAMTDLHESIVPRVKSAPGFVRGIWFRDQENGHGLAVFESEDQARQMATMVPSPSPDDPIQVVDVHVYVVDSARRTRPRPTGRAWRRCNRIGEHTGAASRCPVVAEPSSAGLLL